MDRMGVDLAAHVGFALPFGDFVGRTPISDLLSGTVPLGLELAFRANKNVALGLGMELSPAITKNCDSGADCSATDYRLSVRAIFTSRAGMPMDPWVALGAGYEWMELSESYNPAIELTGWDCANVELGGEFRTGEQGGLGPFVGFSLGEYTSGSLGGTSASIINPSVHAWLQFGIRGVLNP